MKAPLIIALLTASLLPLKARADNTAVENALRNRQELSDFYQALVNTGVNHELREDIHYTVFAPTNMAYERLPSQEYPCLYSAACREEAARIVRNHIVTGETDLNDAAHYRGGMYSLGNRFVSIGETTRNDYIVDGHAVLSMSMQPGVTLYRINGVIANDTELAAVQSVPYAEVPEESVTTRTTRTTVLHPSPTSGPDAVSETTTITRTVVPEQAPAR